MSETIPTTENALSDLLAIAKGKDIVLTAEKAQRILEEIRWLKMTPDQQNADSANYTSPGNWGGYT